MDAREEELKADLKRAYEELRDREAKKQKLEDKVRSVQGDATAKKEEYDLLNLRLQLANEELNQKQSERKQLELELKKLSQRPDKQKPPRQMALELMGHVVKTLEHRLDIVMTTAGPVKGGLRGEGGNALAIAGAPTGKHGNEGSDDEELAPPINQVPVTFEGSTVHFQITVSTTFQNLLEQAALYYSVDPDDCYFTDKTNFIWPADGVVQFEMRRLKVVPILRVALKPGIASGVKKRVELSDSDADVEKKVEEPPTPEELKRAEYRKKYTNPPKQKLYIELAWYILFVGMFITVSMSRRNVIEINTVITSLQTALVTSNFGINNTDTYTTIGSEEEMWRWVEGPLTAGLFPSTEHVMTYGKIVGAVVVKQYRVKINSCDLSSAIRYNGKLDYNGSFVDACFSSFNTHVEEIVPFGPHFNNWTVCNYTYPLSPKAGKNAKPNVLVGRCLAGQYCNGATKQCATCPDKSSLYPDCVCPVGRESEGYPDCLCPRSGLTYPCSDWDNPKKVKRSFCCYDGFFYRPKETGELGVATQASFGSYPVGAYKIALPTNKIAFKDTLANLKQNLWIDKQTRAVIFEFIVYNPNYKSYSVCKFTIEQTAAGLLVPYNPDLQVLNLEIFEWASFLKLFVLEIALWTLIGRFVMQQIIGEMKLVLKGYRSIFPYFAVLWNYFDILTICSISVTYLIRTLFFFDKTRRQFNPFSNTYTDLATAAFLNRLSFQFDAVTVLLMFFKLFKFFGLNEKMGVLWKTLSRSLGMLYGFLFMYFLLFVSFAFMTNIIFGANLSGFSTVQSSITTLLLVLLGDFDFPSWYNANHVWAPILFIFYTVIMFLILLNVFVSILSEAYAAEAEILASHMKYRAITAKKSMKEVYNKAVTEIRRKQADIQVRRLKKRKGKEKEKQITEVREARKKDKDDKRKAVIQARKDELAKAREAKKKKDPTGDNKTDKTEGDANNDKDPKSAGESSKRIGGSKVAPSNGAAEPSKDKGNASGGKKDENSKNKKNK